MVSSIPKTKRVLAEAHEPTAIPSRRYRLLAKRRPVVGPDEAVPREAAGAADGQVITVTGARTEERLETAFHDP